MKILIQNKPKLTDVLTIKELLKDNLFDMRWIFAEWKGRIYMLKHHSQGWAFIYCGYGDVTLTGFFKTIDTLLEQALEDEKIKIMVFESLSEAVSHLGIH